MKKNLGELRDALVSLKLTVVLLLLGMLLVFAATLDQVNLGIWVVQEKYFRSFLVYTRLGNFAIPVFPGGYAIGGLLIANLVASHVYRFTFTWRRAGILLAHFGLILLLVGELLSGLWQDDLYLRIDEGQTQNYAESFRDTELAVTDITDPGFDEVVAIPEKRLERKSSIQHPKLPFRIVPKTYYPNSVLQVRRAGDAAHFSAAAEQATAGLGERITAVPEPVTYRPNERNLPTAFIELVGTDGSIGTYLVSTHLMSPQEFSHGGRTWKIALRARRAYQPFTLTLLKFSHDRYAGTEIPKNFSSRLRLKTPDGRDDREVLISMNSPLRHAGLAFYQAGFENGDRTTILQVVRNPSWLVPYLACTLMTLGLAVQFGIHLVGFAGKRRAARAGIPLAPPQSAAPKPVPPQIA